MSCYDGKVKRINEKCLTSVCRAFETTFWQVALIYVTKSNIFYKILLVSTPPLIVKYYLIFLFPSYLLFVLNVSFMVMNEKRKGK